MYLEHGTPKTTFCSFETISICLQDIVLGVQGALEFMIEIELK